MNILPHNSATLLEVLLLFQFMIISISVVLYSVSKNTYDVSGAILIIVYSTAFYLRHIQKEAGDDD
jgi:hypothetical protein